MANEFENLELKDENTGEIESFTPVDTTARQQIEELNETLTEKDISNQITINDPNNTKIMKAVYKAGWVYLYLQVQIYEGNNEYGTINAPYRPSQRAYGYHLCNGYIRDHGIVYRARVATDGIISIWASADSQDQNNIIFIYPA